MAPITFTETSYLEEPVHTLEIHAPSRIEYKLNHPKEKYLSNTNGKQCKEDSYDQVRGAEPEVFAPLREWERRMGFLTPLRWVNVISITAFHIAGIVWFLQFLLFWDGCKWQTVLFGYFMGQVAGFGVTGGVHRYWCHRSYKAKQPLQWILVICYSVAGQNTIYDWVRDHRVHHKFSETHADPHNANRGFFFSHVGWLMMKKHPHVLREGAKIDMSDIANDPIVQFHTKFCKGEKESMRHILCGCDALARRRLGHLGVAYPTPDDYVQLQAGAIVAYLKELFDTPETEHFALFKVALCWVLPSLVPALFWNESWKTSILSQAVIRYLISLNFTWSVNSFAHIWGNKPYDRYIMPVENWGVSLVAMGEGWHNYHHTFPWDYKAAELGMPLNVTTTLLNFFAKIGWAYDMKQASPSLVKAVAKSRGEHQHEH